MTNVLVRKLEAFGQLPDPDRDLIGSLIVHPQTLGPDVDIIQEGDKPNEVNLIVSGFAYRYKIIDNGSRQIVAYLLPGDFCDLHVFILEAMDHSIATLSETQLVKISRPHILALLDRPAVSRALLMSTLVDESILREWLVNLGQRPAEQRLAHLFCELYVRLKIVGLSKDGSVDLPLTQTQLGETTGLSTVHVNRSLQSLRAQGLIVLRGKRLFIPDLQKLKRLSGFRPNYLHYFDRTAA